MVKERNYGGNDSIYKAIHSTQSFQLIPRYPTYPTLPHISHTIPRYPTRNTTPASTLSIIPVPQDYSLRHVSGFGRCTFGAFAVLGNYSHFAVHTIQFNYLTFQKELLPIYDLIKHFQNILSGHFFMVLTDYTPLSNFISQLQTNAMRQR